MKNSNNPPESKSIDAANKNTETSTQNGNDSAKPSSSSSFLPTQCLFAASTPSVTMAAAQVSLSEPKKLEGFSLYSRFALAGAVCCSVTHGGLTPVDVYVDPSPVAALILPCWKLGHDPSHIPSDGGPLPTAFF